jgi:hypothetical protein
MGKFEKKAMELRFPKVAIGFGIGQRFSVDDASGSLLTDPPTNRATGNVVPQRPPG